MSTTNAKNEAMETLRVIVAKLDALSLEVAALKATKPASGGGAPAAGMLPNYGRAKGQPIRGSDEATLMYYRQGCERTLADESKARWHDKERQMLAAIDAELARLQGGEVPQEEAPF